MDNTCDDSAMVSVLDQMDKYVTIPLSYVGLDHKIMTHLGGSESVLHGRPLHSRRGLAKCVDEMISFRILRCP